MAAAVYDDIGGGYAAFRRPDPRIEAVVRAALRGCETVVNVGAGTGSYEPADRTVTAVEPSRRMIRQRPAHAARCMRAVAEALPFRDRAFDAATAILTIHHWSDPVAGLRELARVANRVVVLTFDPALHRSLWLFRDYLPAIARLPSTDPPSVSTVADVIGADRVETVPVPHDCTDGFGWAYWRRPDAYLDPAVRHCISACGLLEEADVARGVERLRADLTTGRWHERYRDLLGLEAVDGGFRLVVREGR